MPKEITPYKKIILFIVFTLHILAISGCKIYSFTGASISGKTINIYTFENRASNVVPTLAPVISEKVRNRILSQTGLTAKNTDEVDYLMKSYITGYNVSITGMQGTMAASQNRLTITLEVEFINKLDEKQSFKSSFSRFADFSATQQLQSVENSLIEEICNQLAEDIFNKAFVNW
jgi:hypothetical protein